MLPFCDIRIYAFKPTTFISTPARRHHPASGGTDIVGYSALMGNYEQKAFSILDKNRAVQKPIIEQFSGRWIKELGDGVMANFNTFSDTENLIRSLMS